VAGSTKIQTEPRSIYFHRGPQFLWFPLIFRELEIRNLPRQLWLHADQACFEIERGSVRCVRIEAVGLEKGSVRILSKNKEEEQPL
jgi:hypothetical protein